MLKDSYSQVMDSSDNGAITWLLNFAQKSPSLKESIETFERYYQECVQVLLNKELTDKELEGTENRIKIIHKYLQSENFLNKLCLDNNNPNAFPILTKEELEAIKNISLDKDDNENTYKIMSILGKSKQDTLKIIRKIDRFYNMQLKYGHTARITYVAARNIEKLKITNEIAIKAILTSALMHDIGRFYQAANYNTLVDSKMEETIVVNNNGKPINLNVDHAIAGYYYSLMDLYQLSAIGKAKYDDLIIHSIAAVIVRFHQKSNRELLEFENPTVSNEFSEELETELIEYIIKSYQQAKFIERKKSRYMYDEEHISFIDRIIKKIIEEKKQKVENQLENSFINVEYNEEDRQRQLNIITEALKKNATELEKRLITYYNNPSTKEGQEILRVIVKEIKDKINQSKEFEIIKEEEIEKIIKSLADYDIAEEIDRSFKSKESIPTNVKSLISLSLNCTMDADKIDILNQRAIGIYNTEYNPSYYKIYPGETKSLVDLLNEFYGFNLNKNELKINNSLLLIVNKNTNQSQKDWFKRQGIDLDSLLEQTKDDEILIEASHPLYNIIAISPWKNIIANDKKTKKDYKSNDIPVLSVPREIIEENLKDKSETEKINLYRRLLIVPEQTELFQTSDTFSREVQQLNDEYRNQSQNHIIWNPILGLIWQLNQFIMVNIRNKASIEFIRESQILEKIYHQYDQYPTIQAIIKPYIAYTLLFTDVLLKLKTNGHDIVFHIADDSYKSIQNYTSEIMTKAKQIVANTNVFNNSVLMKYCEFLENHQTMTETVTETPTGAMRI